MRKLKAKAFGVKKFRYMQLDPHWSGVLGRIEPHFQMVVYGESGNGKTEFCLQLAKRLSKIGRVDWISYEQGHGGDLQAAIKRNRFDLDEDNVIFIDPLVTRDKQRNYFDDLLSLLGRKGTRRPKFLVIDSLDYTGFTWDNYRQIKELYGRKIGFIWIAHARGRNLIKSVSDKIKFDGHIAIEVVRYVAWPRKNRYGGFDPHIVYERMARQHYPELFESSSEEE